MNTIHLNDRTVDLATGAVAGPGVEDVLSARVLQLLRHLVAHRGEVLSRDHILAAVWGHIEAASDDSLNVAISALRRSLGDTARPHRIVQTRPRRGYAYIGPEPEQADETVEAPTVVPQRARSRLVPGLVLAAVLATVAFAAFRGPHEPPAAGPAAGKPRVAVLPFEDFSTDGDHLGFANGLTDQLLHSLAQLDGLEVIARTSSYALREDDLTVAEIGERLQVRAVLEGSVQRSGQTVRVVAQLIDVETEAHLWSRTYDRPAGEILAIQDQVADTVAESLSVTLLPRAARPPVNVAVFEELAMGRYELDKFTLEAARAAQVHFERVLELEPDHADAHALLADALRVAAVLGGRAFRSNQAVADRERYLALINRSYELDPESSIVLQARASVAFSRGDAEATIRTYRRAIELAPGDADPRGLLGRALWRYGRHDESLAELSIAGRLDPLNLEIDVWLADAFWGVGRAEEAVARLRRGADRHPDYPRYHDQLALYLTRMGQGAEAMTHNQYLQRLDPGSARFRYQAGALMAPLGAIDRAEACAQAFGTDEPDSFFDRYLQQLIAGFRRDFERQQSVFERMREA
ncbi:MAG: winged helix-turn-helix domain-containing protein, partial [Pseudomonadota bacterium]